LFSGFLNHRRWLSAFDAFWHTFSPQKRCRVEFRKFGVNGALQCRHLRVAFRFIGWLKMSRQMCEKRHLQRRKSTPPPSRKKTKNNTKEEEAWGKLLKKTPARKNRSFKPANSSESYIGAHTLPMQWGMSGRNSIMNHEKHEPHENQKNTRKGIPPSCLPFRVFRAFRG
jgi:hypothetical protein